MTPASDDLFDLQFIKTYNIPVDVIGTDAEASTPMALYLRGKGVEQDNDRARYWINCAADQGFEKAKILLDKNLVL